MLSTEQAWALLAQAELVYSREQVAAAIARVAEEITARLGSRHPVLLSVMGGAVVFTGQLLPLLRFPLEFDYVHASRYGRGTQGQELIWKVLPSESVKGRVVLVLDDILDEGRTLAAILDKLRELGAAEVYTAVLTEKETGRPKPIEADFVGLKLPNRFVFGCGMDVHGAWRNLPEIYALKQN
ncbi:hypoxanthine-guanine phosphoribosyltransferase [Thiobacter aerophilum]|uniref:Hypoxanthine-guanine phosphoribosyltransferase n=1 Tax=Thiobacter aerophilum TaxID=3121275 RepID=A0ABV0EAS2_9BURK